MASIKFTILGCGSSGGVPRIGRHGSYWGQCDPLNPKNRRRRCSLLVQRIARDRATNVLIDTSPDLRVQLLDAGVGMLDAVVYTHAHADHVNGLDDLRMVYLNRRARVPVWADESTFSSLFERFSYAFFQPDGSDYPPILDPHPIQGPIVIQGEAGPVKLTPFNVFHGSTTALGYRIGPVAYTPDVSHMLNESWNEVTAARCWIVDALRQRPHPSHSHLGQTLNWIECVQPEQAILTDLHTDLDYQAVSSKTPDHVHPAFDGLSLTYEI